MTDEEDLDAANAIMESLERRWAVADQQVFISSVILNPFYQGRPFARLYFLNNAGIHSLLGHLWSRFFKTEPSQDFHTELTEYLTHTGRYANLASHCARAGHEAHTKVHCLFTSSTSIYAQLIVFQGEHPDPISIYIDFSFAGQPPTPFIRLARRILSVCANSATCERLWSVFGNTLTKLRNRLGIETLTSLSELKMHIRDEHVQKETKKRMKRMFVTRSEAARTANKTQQPLPPPVNELSTSGDPDIDENFDPTARPQSNDRFWDMAARHSLSAQEDETDREPVTNPNVIGRTVKLVELFNFTEPYWISQYERAARRTFDEELELYELLDLDAEGEEQVNIDVDDSTGEILIG